MKIDLIAMSGVRAHNLAARLYSEEFTRERRKRFHRRWRSLRPDKDRRQEEIEA